MKPAFSQIDPSGGCRGARGPEEVHRLAQAFRHSASGIALLSIDGRWLDVNPAFCRLVGYRRDALVGRSFVEVTHADDVERNLKQLERLRRKEISSFGLDKRYVRSDGSEVWVRLDVSMVLDAVGAPDFIITQAHDVTVSKKVKEQLADREARLRSVIRSMGEGVVVIDADGTMSLANQRAREILGLDEDMMRCATIREFSDRCERPDRSRFEQGEFPAETTLATGEPCREVLMRLDRPDHAECWIEVSTEPVRGEHEGVTLGVVATFSDITDRVRTERALKESEERLSLALEGAKLGMWDWHLDRREFKFNKIAERILGYHRGEVAPRLESVRSLVHPDDDERLVEVMEAHLHDARPFFEVDARMRRKTGGYVWTNIRGRVTERDESDRPIRVTGMLIDISQRKELEGQLKRLATTDELTGLFNRRRGTEALRAEIERSRRRKGTFSFILLDIDRFKSVNDRFGHDVGDRVLTDVAELLLGRLRRTDLAARWGGEEFALILPDADREDGRRFAEELLARMKHIRTPDGSQITASFGVVDYRQDESASELVKRADRLMYRAKHAGRARVETESDSPDARDAAS